MTIQDQLKSYSDIRKFVPPAIFTSAMAYWSWHNRLPNTAMLETWQALVVALAFEQKHIDGLAFTAVKSYLEARAESIPGSLEDCRRVARDLVAEQFGAR